MQLAMEEVESKTINKVVANVEACLKVLTSLWDETGLDKSDRIDQHKDLIADVERALQGRVNEAKDLKAKQCLKLRLASVRIKTVYAQLGCECPPEFQSYKVPNPDDDDAKSSWVDNKTSRPSLQAQLDNLEEILAAAEAQRVVRFEIISAKAEHLRSLLLEQHGVLSEEQEAIVKMSGDIDLSEEREDELDNSLKEAKEAQQDRILAISDLVSELQNIWTDIGVEKGNPEWDEIDEKVQERPHSLESSVAMMQQLEQRAAMLRTTQKERSVKVAAQKETLLMLWRRIKVSEHEQEQYLAQHAGLQLPTIATHAKTIEQLDAQLGSMLAKLIAEAVEHARELRILVMEDQDPTRDAAKLPKPANNTREALESVEAEIARLEGRLEKRVPVLKQVERRAAILKEAVELRSAATDPSRLLDRGGNSFRIRQQEERRRNLVGKELPRLTEKLRKMVVEWEEAEGEPFVLSGRRFLEAMDEERAREEKERDEEKERERQRREMVKSVRANGGPSGAVPASPSMSPAPRPSPMRPQTAGSARREPRFNTHPPQPSPKPHLARASSKHPVLQHSQSAKDLERTGAVIDKENVGQGAVALQVRLAGEGGEEYAERTVEEGVQTPRGGAGEGEGEGEGESGMSLEVSASEVSVNVSVNEVSVNEGAEASAPDAPAPDAGGGGGAVTAPVEVAAVVPASGGGAGGTGGTGGEAAKRKSRASRCTLAAVAEEGGAAEGGAAKVAKAPACAGTPKAAGGRRGEPDPEQVAEMLGHWDYLGDNYYTEEERTEIGREVLREMQERHEELRSAKKRIKFKKGELLGAGSFGQVFLGLNEGTGELLAVKEVDCSKAGEAAIASLEAEIEMLQQLRHPNIVAYYGVERGENLSVLVEYCAGGSIASVIQTFGALNEQVVRSYTRQILVGLDYLHKHCIVHRDVKCANVLLDADGNVKVADFGASRKMSSINGEAAAMSMKGTPFFMAPEVIKQTAVGRQSDLWSVGCCVVEMCTSRPPFANQFSNVAALLWHIAKTVAPPVLPEGLSQECHDFCALCFKREPEERPSARRLLRHPFVATWNVEAAKQRINANTSQSEDSRLSVAANRRISALF